MGYGKFSKLSLRYVGLFEILRRVGVVAYLLEMPPTLKSIHVVFHISMLKRCIHDAFDKFHFSKLEIQNAYLKDEDHSNCEGSLEESLYGRRHIRGRN